MASEWQCLRKPTVTGEVRRTGVAAGHSKSQSVPVSSFLRVTGNKGLVAVFDFVGHPSVATSVQSESLGCDLLAQEVLGFGFFVVPLLQLLGTKEVDDPLTNRIAICNNLADDVGFSRVGILLDVARNSVES